VHRCQVGVGIHGDALKMQRDWGLQLGGVVDLSEAAQDRGVCNGEPGAKWSLAGELDCHTPFCLMCPASYACGDPADASP
jgi:hypothetical protein